MKEKRNILLTFDFELFLGGKSGTVGNCMLKPAYELLQIVTKYKASTIFFVDTLYLHFLKKQAELQPRAKADYEGIVKLLREFIDAGSYVFHHLHPHWLDANYIVEENEWDLSNLDRFALCNLQHEEVKNVFAWSEAIISEIYDGKNRPAHSGFRAGGLYVQPFSQYMDEMRRYNIKFEMSVVKHAKGAGIDGTRKFDFSTFPDKNIFPFSDDVLVKDKEGFFIELMMDQFQLNGLKKIINGLYYRRNVNKESWKKWGDGKAAGNVVRSTKKANRLISEETFSIELLNNYKAKLYLKHLKGVPFLQIISHPKFFTPASLSAFDYFMKKAHQKYEVETDLFQIINDNQ